MLDFYLLPEWAVISLAAFHFTAVLMEVSAGCFMYQRSVRKPLRTAFLLEALVLLDMLILSYLFIDVVHNDSDGLVYAAPCRTLRIAVFLLLLAAGLLIAVKRRRKSALLPALAAVLTLPAAEDAAGEYFVLLFAASMLFLFFRSTYYVLTLHRSAQGISARSVKAALDTLPAGLLFCSDDGTVLMQNRQMQLLMKATTGIMFRNGDAFSDRIRNGDLREDCSRSIRGDITVVRLPDGTVWSFKTKMVGENEESGRLLTAADITERWNATEELDRQRRRLQDESDSLHAVLKELESLYTIRETELMQASLHDIMGQKISLLLRAIRENKTPDEELLKSFTRDFLSEFENPPAASPSQALKALQDTYSALSVSVIVKGRPADDPEAADVQMKTTFEAVTNAVRHGYADEIVLVFSRTKDCWRLDITDDGIAPEGPIREGGGLSEIRRRVQSLGGSFSYRTSPGFSLTIQTPAVPGSSAAS